MIDKIKKLELCEGDVLVIYVNRIPDRVNEWSENLSKILPWKNKVLVLTKDVEISVIKKKYKSLWDME